MENADSVGSSFGSHANSDCGVFQECKQHKYKRPGTLPCQENEFKKNIKI